MSGFPATFGRYKIIDKIGEGAFGYVFIARDELIGRKVAVKCLRFDHRGTARAKQRRLNFFLNEAKIIGSLKHPHITAIYDMGVQEDMPYIVMELIEGETIKDIIRKGSKHSLRETLLMIATIARALHYVHQRGFLHRDIKPANIIIEPNNTPKVMDFGIAMLGTPTDADVTEMAATLKHNDPGVVGTPYYMSPEQVRGGEMDGRSDLFSLGTLCYEWLSGGERPFTGKTPNQVTSAVLMSHPRPLSKVTPFVDRTLEQIIDKAMAKAPENRYRSLDAFSDELEIYCSKLNEADKDAGAVLNKLSPEQLEAVRRLRRKYVFFSDFNEAELSGLLTVSRRERYGKDATIIHQGTSGLDMYLMLQGSAMIRQNVDGIDVNIKVLKAGDCFGEMAIVDKAPRSASVVALEETFVIAINEAVLRKSKPELSLKLYRNLAAVISENLRKFSKRHQDLIAGLDKMVKRSRNEIAVAPDEITLFMDGPEGPDDALPN